VIASPERSSFWRPGVAMVLFYLVTYVFGNMGAFLVVEAVAQVEGSVHPPAGSLVLSVATPAS